MVLVLSCRHFMNVVCNWGRKGLSAMPPFLIMMVNVDKIALFTCQGNRSPMIRIRGPVIGITNSFRACSLVTSINSPRPSAACSLSSADPLIRPCRKIGSTGRRAFGRQNPGTRTGPPLFFLRSLSLAVDTASRTNFM
uniref:Uncharacterized protein n=1 Tax=Opuntia streptacantha TaxID=393608 RepID=A0A7C9CPZ7_OPUST